MEIIVVAAGSGRRFGGEVPKQFRLLAGRPVVMRSLEALHDARPEARLTLVLSPGMEQYWQELCAAHGFALDVAVVAGGATRWESVKHGIEALADRPAGETVLIHDGARPLVDAATVGRVAAAALNTDGALPAVAVTDSLRRLAPDGGPMGSEAVERADFRAVQTPQGFALWRLREAYSLPYSEAFTDDASVMAEAGFDNIVLVEGSPSNIKITNPQDLVVAEAILKE